MMICPKCGHLMSYGRLGIRADGSDAVGWFCHRLSIPTDQCWCEVFDGEPPWPFRLWEDPQMLAEFNRRYGLSWPTSGYAPPPSDWDWTYQKTLPLLFAARGE